MRVTRKKEQRRAAVMVVVLVCLMVLLMLGGVLLRRAQTQRAQVHAEEFRAQAEWLAEAGLERASARLSASPDYDGETWDLAPESLTGRWPGRVVIAVQNVNGNPGRRMVRVRADYPVHEALRARQSKQAVIELGSSRAGEN
jgi:hypothetical protein